MAKGQTTRMGKRRRNLPIYPVYSKPDCRNWWIGQTTSVYFLSSSTMNQTDYLVQGSCALG